jgi:hypothetical protein
MAERVAVVVVEGPSTIGLVWPLDDLVIVQRKRRMLVKNRGKVVV